MRRRCERRVFFSVSVFYLSRVYVCFLFCQVSSSLFYVSVFVSYGHEIIDKLV